jgi:hypothetical protein
MEKKNLDTKQIRTGSDPLSQIRAKHQAIPNQPILEKNNKTNNEAIFIPKVIFFSCF